MENPSSKTNKSITSSSLVKPFVIDVSSKSSKLSPRNILTAIGSRFFNLNQELTESDKTMVLQMEDTKTTTPTQRRVIRREDKTQKEEKAGKEDKNASSPTRDRKKYSPQLTAKETQPGRVSTTPKILDRDLRKFKTRYNNSVGNVMRDWMGLVYSVLILRMNAIKFIMNKMPEYVEMDVHFQRQIVLENQTVYSMIRDAQQISQDQFLFLWTQLEKLIINRKILKNAFQAVKVKETGLRDWQTAASKLAELEGEFCKSQEEYEAAQNLKNQLEGATKEKIVKLEKQVQSKEDEYNMLVEKITEMKKREVQMRGKILINMKSYKDLKTKRQKLMSVEEEMNKLKTEQNTSVAEYSTKIQTLKNEIEEKERQIKEQKEEKKKMKAWLEGIGDYSEKQTDLLVQGT